ncbi:MAG: hypothetical protein ACM3SY_19555 [Candidatus Omnitrophota bacterium]
MKTGKAILILVFVTLLSFPLTGKKFVKSDLNIVINEKGELVEINDIKITTSTKGEEVVSQAGKAIDPVTIERMLNRKFKKGTTISVSVRYNGKCPECWYEVNKINIETELIPLGPRPTGKNVSLIEKTYKRKPEYKITLSESGKIYKIKITIKSTSLDGKTKEDVIFERDFETYAVYFLGMHLGFLFPSDRTASYGILYQSPNATIPIITKDTLYNPKVLLYGAIYPFGYEPESPIFSHPLKRLHFDLGSELSGNIFKKIYFGIGYDLRYLSLSVFAYQENIEVLRQGFEVGGEINPKNPAVPLYHKSHTSLGIGLGLPLNSAVNWLGKILSIKK